ncbi:homeobox protein ATH1 [Euphorbia lathyris]|uniref:homeobox protein ATH1 n=1 Tax=Euphorbia lathyris TaxID=212925 RepID=UPI0033144939
MENRLFSVPLGRNSVPTMEGIAPNSLAEFESFDLNNQNQTLDCYNLLSTLQGSSRAEQFVSGIPFSGPAPLTTIVATRNGRQENVATFAISEPPIYPLEALRTCVSNEFANGLTSSFTSSVNYGSDQVFGNVNSKGESNRFPAPVRAEFQPFSWISTNSVNISNDNLYGSCNFSNELSLSLATSQPSAINGTNISDQCSEISCPGGYTPRCLKESTSSSSKELSLSCSSYRNGKFSHVLSGSKYLQVVQEILTQIASYSMEILERMCFSTGGMKMGTSISFSSMYATERGMGLICPDETPNEDDGFEVHVDPALRKRAIEAKKAQLLTLLQVVDDQYSQCLDEIHTVVSAFHAATELDPQMHTRFVLQTISFLYKSLRERISNQILAMGAHADGGGGMRDSEEGGHESCYFQKQWTLQQLKKRDHQLWKPQRGLPERSVSVLRAWMFQNFLHPYPKDAEKHLLAVKSGLTRSQVSNWFINARVRLWKPMIEEMYAEMNKRKGPQNEEGSSNNNHRNHISFSNLRFNVN